MGKRYMLFDVDGTLTDPAVGITRGVQHALRAYGIEETDRKKLYRFIGPPLKDSFMDYYDFPEEKAREAMGKYREYYREIGIFENQVYDGIGDMLKDLKEHGAVVMTATSKPEEFASRILKHFHLDQYFDYICGASMDEKRVKKGDVIAYALERAGIRDVKEAVMIGDREHDVLGARENHMDCVGVLFGYGSREELKKAGAVETAASVDELRMLLLTKMHKKYGEDS